ncbi:hypothetical protein OK016_21060 [Vibrio chagasii]|nr:hypothetical protein [Vibrio chagasii]
MYFWNIKGLKADIKADKLSEKDRFRYVFIYIALGTRDGIVTPMAFQIPGRLSNQSVSASSFF